MMRPAVLFGLFDVSLAIHSQDKIKLQKATFFAMPFISSDKSSRSPRISLIEDPDNVLQIKEGLKALQTEAQAEF
ncbi:hypothetical protein QR680_004235 [Steinernema hermaphroditum]|uniref:Uncharacterized protein n=1 Tax=Steinernema hermaphroditum TaxID=289476 RepID=A0AA39HQ95_9BILA|nr:hypothetical protein QR680_004235 [Steinernema hermaphroditum]